MQLTLSAEELRPLVQTVVEESLRQLDSIQAATRREPQDEPLLVDVPTAAKMLSICSKTLWALTDSGQITAVRIGRSVRYDPDDLRTWIARTKATKAAAAAENTK